MTLIKTKAIVFSSLKYGDTSLIVRCFTLEDGLRSYLLKGVLSAKKGKVKPAYFQPLTQLNIEANHNKKGSLNSIREVHIINPYKNIYTNIFKQTIVLFLSEILSSTIQEEEANEALFSFLETSLIWLDTNDKTSNFHLLFLLNLTKFLGFYPDTTHNNHTYFNLIDGVFTETTTEKEVVYGSDLVQFKKLLGTNFDGIESIKFNQQERQQVLQTILRYFELQLDGFRQPKSLKILETVFN
ncbi:DNA repair protein RecO [Polaribacter huanghezhanensis]|uniref:DNA repair protein RecO n=1 Tax=Polaribacter huanghezhanensis TaxID=1354726 RepID=UPI002649E9BA|nr:DNA repair protein RecO [Polaribacter huanghezhanensis]WKD85526.1 DNA repair protein RecO [Polaribacter huanghezhanensis]